MKQSTTQPNNPNAPTAVRSSDGLGIRQRIQKLKQRKDELLAENYAINDEIENLENDLRKLKESSKKQRYLTALRLRSRGKTYKEIGEGLGVSMCRGMEIAKRAERLWNNGRL